jgi:KaiC/GvpD/RAD55 family RecA-like ATPase
MSTSTQEVSKMLGVPFSIIPPKPVDPLWEGWFLRRHVTLLVAPGGTGKGLLTIDMAARVTQGKTFPGEPEGTVHEPEAVVLVSPEDDPNETVAWRLRAAGADLALVFNLTVLPDGSRFTLPDSVTSGTLGRAVAEIEKATGKHVGLVVIDPLFAVSAVNLSANKGARSVIDPLEQFAHDGRCAVVLTHHTVKSGATAGSKGLIDACRVVLRIGRDDKELSSSIRVLTVEKANALSDTTDGIRYCIAGGGETTCVTWPVEVELLAAQLKSRGYEITQYPLEPKPGRHAAPGTTVFNLYQSDGAHSASLLGTRFATVDAARTHAEHVTGHVLPWKPGPIEGSSGGAATAADGSFTYFSVIPATV